jgi:DNA-binding GntR family transcriptional regulator
LYFCTLIPQSVCKFHNIDNYESLRHQIISGIYQQDDLLPSENQLADLHQITRMTVRQALNELVKDGYIRKQKGKEVL